MAEKFHSSKGGRLEGNLVEERGGGFPRTADPGKGSNISGWRSRMRCGEEGFEAASFRGHAELSAVQQLRQPGEQRQCSSHPESVEQRGAKKTVGMRRKDREQAAEGMTC